MTETPAPVSPVPQPQGVVFIVEDDMFLLKAYEIKFKKAGIDVWTAADGKAALSFLEKDPPKIVLLDLLLPGISGFDILSAIRKNPKWKAVPVFILTNLGQSQEIERVKALGIEDYLVKANTKINDIVERVKKYL